MIDEMHDQKRPILAGPSAIARVAADGHVARLVPFTHLFRHSFEIEALSRAALDANPSYHPAAIAAYALASGLAPRLRLVLVHDASGVLRAFAPLVTRRLGAPFRLPRALLVEGAESATPLIDRASPEAVATLVRALAESGGARFDRLPVEAATTEALTRAATRVAGLRAVPTAPAEIMILDGRDPDAIADRLDADYCADLAAAREALVARFGRLSLEKLTRGPRFVRAMEELRALLGAALPPGIDTLARAQDDDSALVIHRLRAGRQTLAMALGLVSAYAYAGLAIGIDRALAAPATPPIFSAMLTDALARDELIDRATGNTDFVSPAWTAEPVATLLVGSPMRIEAERALGTLARLMRAAPAAPAG